MRDKTLVRWLAKQAAALYHGSQSHGLTSIEPRESRVIDGDAAVFSTPRRDMALAYTAPWSDEDLEQGLVNDQHYLREMSPGALDRVYGGRRGSLYSLPGGGFTSDSRLMPEERISRRAVAPDSEEEIGDILQALRDSGTVLGRHGEKLPWDEAD